MEFQNLFHVGKEHFLFIDQVRFSFELVTLVAQGVEIEFNANLQVFDICLLRL